MSDGYPARVLATLARLAVEAGLQEDEVRDVLRSDQHGDRA